MRVAVTGATGFLGRPLIQALQARGDQILALSRSRAAIPGAQAGYFEAGQPLEPGALDGVDAVVHLAGEPVAKRWTATYKDRLIRSRVEGTRTIAQALRGTHVRVLISASATGYYGPHGAEELDESSPSGADFLSGLCRAWEEAAQPARDAGVRVVHPRIGIVLHPEGGALAKMLTPFRMGVGGRLGSGEQYMSWIHRADLLSLFLFALDHDALRGPINGTAPQPVTNAEFTRALGRALHRPAVMAAPGFAIKLAMGEASDILLTGQRVLPKKGLAAGFSFAHPSLDGALADLLGIPKPSTG
jgi:uncharacterized protein (TIGR01777 family)